MFMGEMTREAFYDTTTGAFVRLRSDADKEFKTGNGLTACWMYAARTRTV